MGYDYFSSAPVLGSEFGKALDASSPLDNSNLSMDIAVAPIFSGSHAPVKDKEGNPVPGGITG